MALITSCTDTKDILDFFKSQGLYLKPISRLNISVQLPVFKKSGAKISNWEVMEKVKEMAKPFFFPIFKVAKSSLEFIRFEAEIENFGSLDQALSKLDNQTIKLSGFSECLKIRAAEAKIPFPTRQEWDSYFRENKGMNEMKAGERPDTIHISNCPTKWFINHYDKSGVSRDKPSIPVVKRVFETFGSIKAIDIPLLDPYRDQIKSSSSPGISTFSFSQDHVFDAYIQYKEYIGFVKAMNSLKGMKLLYKDKYENRSWVSNIQVDFDKTKHLSEASIKKRASLRDKIIQREREKEENERRDKELEEYKRADEIRRRQQPLEKSEERKTSKDKRRDERESKRRALRLKGKNKSKEELIEEEEEKLLLTTRKLESIRILSELFQRLNEARTSKRKVEEDISDTNLENETRQSQDRKREKRENKELTSQIRVAARIAEEDRRAQSRDRKRFKTSTFSEKKQYFESVKDFREKRRVERRNEHLTQEKNKEEAYDRMMHPHLYGDPEFKKSSYRRNNNNNNRKQEHYEVIQKEFLDNEIRIRERRERRKSSLIFHDSRINSRRPY